MASTITNLDNIDVWKTKSNFNYNEWQQNIIIKICSVPWDRNDNVVRWDSVDDRRDYFNAIYGIVIDNNEYSKTLNTLMGGERIRVNVPYGKIINSNYLAVFGNYTTPPFSPEQPVVEQGGIPKIADLPYPNDGMGDLGVLPLDRFYFIDDIRQVSPSVTELTLSLDVWGTFSQTVYIDHAHYDRGHYMCQDITPEEFLSDKRYTAKLNTEPEPININTQFNKANILPLNETFSNGSDSVQLMTCLITEAPLEDTGSGWQTSDGYAVIPVNPSNATDGAVDGLYCYAIASSEAKWFIDKLANSGKPYLKAIRCAFNAISSWLDLSSTPLEIGGYTIYPVYACDKTAKFIASINTASFVDSSVFPTSYYKAYEGQFLPIDIFYGENYLGSIGLENTATTLNAYVSSSIVYPFIDFQAFFTGLSSRGDNNNITYTYSLMNGTSATATINASDWERTLVDLEIPVFALGESPVSRWAMEHKPAYDTAELNATNAKTSADASNTTNKDNATRSADTAKTIGDNSAATARDTANASNNAAKTNADNAVNTAKTNADASNDQSRDNALRVASDTRTNAQTATDATHANAYTTLNLQAHNGTQALNEQSDARLINAYWQGQIHTQRNAINNNNWNFDYANTDHVKEEMQAGLGYEIRGQITQSAISTAGSLALTAATGGLTAPLALAQVGVSAGSTGASVLSSTSYSEDKYNLARARENHNKNQRMGAIDNDYNNTVGLAKDLEQGTDSISGAVSSHERAWGWRDYDEDMLLSSLSANQTIADKNQTTSNTIADVNKTLATDTTNASHDTEASNISRSATTSLNANTLSHDTTASNITANYNTATGNNTLSHDTATTNINASYNTTASNINRARQQVTDDITLDQKNALNQNLISDGSYGGNYLNQQAGRQYYKFVTRYPSETDQTQINDMFDEYGYTWNEYVNNISPSDLVDDGRGYNYWKLNDIRFNYFPAIERYRNAIKGDLEKGVRIWDAWKISGMTKESA